MSSSHENEDRDHVVSEQQELINAIDRNTAATRSIGLFLFGSFFWVLGGVAILLAPFFLGLEGTDVSNLFGLVGLSLISFGSIRSVLLALKEFRYSQFFEPS
jgi:VIT1/CCC1 family predicted Fe2+/Mn2+ transporter